MKRALTVVALIVAFLLTAMGAAHHLFVDHELNHRHRHYSTIATASDLAGRVTTLEHMNIGRPDLIEINQRFSRLGNELNEQAREQRALRERAEAIVEHIGKIREDVDALGRSHE